MFEALTQECDDSLVCREDEEARLQSIETTAGRHYYCSFRKHKNTDQYEDISRGDEACTRQLSIQRNHRTAMKCTRGNKATPGLFCGDKCKANYEVSTVTNLKTIDIISLFHN